MINRLMQLKKDELVRGSTILFIMIMLYNFFNYIFQISMAKFLGPADYGILAVLMSIIYIFTIPSEAIQNIITKHVSILNIRGENGKIKDLLIRSLKKGLLFSFVIFILFIIFSLFLSSFLNISKYLIILTGFFIFLVFLVPVVRGVLQGTKKFLGLGTNMIIESSIKIIISLCLVILGWKVYGAMMGVLFGTLFSLLIIVFPLRKILNSEREEMPHENIYSTSVPIIVSALCIVLMYSIDIILARRFFPDELAGQYAFISLIAKVIIFVSSAIGKAMFPISVGEFNSGKKESGLLKKSILIVSILSIFSLILYLLIPETLVRLISLNSNEYISASHLLFNLGLAYSFLSISYIIILYKLSQNKLNHSSWFLLIFFAIQLVLLYSFNSNLTEYTWAMLFSSLFIFLYSLFLIKK